MKKILLIALYLFAISSTTTHANDITVISSDAGSSDVVEVLIRGNGGYCSLWMDSLGDVQKTDCIRLTNSKKTKILCTKKKEICKTEKEVYDYLKKELSSDSTSLNEEETLVTKCKNEKLNSLILVDGEYSWFTTNAEASIVIKKNTNGLYMIKGEAYSGTGNVNGPRVNTVEFSAPINCGTLFYKDSDFDYMLTIKIQKDGSFYVEDEGEVAAFFSGHFTSKSSVDISCKKANSFIEKSVCMHPELSILFKEEVKSYTQVEGIFLYYKNRENLKKTIQKDEGKWISSLSECEHDEYKACLKNKYENRIKELNYQFNFLQTSFREQDDKELNKYPNHAKTNNEVDIKKILSDYENNEIGADNKYRGKRIQTTGTITSIKKDLFGQPYVTLGTSAEFEIPEIQASFDDSMNNQLGQLRKGSKLTVSCRVTGLMMNVIMNECKIVSYGSIE